MPLPVYLVYTPLANAKKCEIFAKQFTLFDGNLISHVRSMWRMSEVEFIADVLGRKYNVRRDIHWTIIDRLDCNVLWTIVHLDYRLKGL